MATAKIKVQKALSELYQELGVAELGELWSEDLVYALSSATTPLSSVKKFTGAERVRAQRIKDALLIRIQDKRTNLLTKSKTGEFVKPTSNLKYNDIDVLGSFLTWVEDTETGACIHPVAECIVWREEDNLFATIKNKTNDTTYDKAFFQEEIKHLLERSLIKISQKEIIRKLEKVANSKGYKCPSQSWFSTHFGDLIRDLNSNKPKNWDSNRDK